MNKLHKLLENPAFLEASREELRVLVAILASEKLDTDDVSVICDISRARAKSAISFWQESGILLNSGAPSITEEFEERLLRGEIEEEPSKKVAKDIRDMALADMLSECARLMNKAVLSTQEVKKIVALRTQYALSDEYILTLAAYLSDKNSLSVPRLIDKALKFVEKGIDSAEALEAHIKIIESESGVIRELKKTLGITDRPLSTKEKEYFKKWSSEYGYFTEIIGMAFDICVNNISRRSFAYMDKVLTAWYNAGCRTRSECLQKSEEVRLELKKKNKEKATKKKAEEKPRYGDFDVKDAFKRALERSYGKDEKQ